MKEHPMRDRSMAAIDLGETTGGGSGWLVRHLESVEERTRAMAVRYLELGKKVGMPPADEPEKEPEVRCSIDETLRRTDSHLDDIDMALAALEAAL